MGTKDDAVVEDLKTAVANASYDSQKYLEIIERTSLKLFGQVLSIDEFAARIEHDPKESTNVLVYMYCEYDEYDLQWQGPLSEAPKGSDKVKDGKVTYSIVERTWELGSGNGVKTLVIELEPVL
tara:strand:+ start:1864 stop:2235 length:372 start_codon:yes stop_codon:yes gene_type:complete